MPLVPASTLSKISNRKYCLLGAEKESKKSTLTGSLPMFSSPSSTKWPYYSHSLPSSRNLEVLAKLSLCGPEAGTWTGGSVLNEEDLEGQVKPSTGGFVLDEDFEVLAELSLCDAEAGT